MALRVRKGCRVTLARSARSAPKVRRGYRAMLVR